MNLPNKLTLVRIILIPIIMIVYGFSESWRDQTIIWDHLSIANFIALILIALGAFTDFLDGHIARKYNLVTNLGKFLDPLADKLLTCTGFIILMQQNAYNHISNPTAPNLITWWMVIVILAREFMVTGIRLLAVEQGKVIAASKLGKSKTVLQFVTIIYLFAGGYIPGDIEPMMMVYIYIAYALIIATLAMTIFSGYDYIVKNMSVLKETKRKLKKNKK